MAQKTGGKSPATDPKQKKAPAEKRPAAKPQTKPKAKTKQTASAQAAKKPAGAKAGTRKQPQKAAVKRKALSNEIKGILIIACGVFLTFAFLTETTGAVGSFVKDVFYGLLGMASAISCIFIVLTGFNVFVNKDGSGNVPRFFLLAGLMVSTSILVCLFSSDTSFVEGGFVDQVVTLYRNGIQSHGGGILGGGLCKILVKLIGITGTWVLAIASELILGILLTGISIEALFRKITGAIRQHSQQVRDYANSEIELEPYPSEDLAAGKAPGRAGKRPAFLGKFRQKDAGAFEAGAPEGPPPKARREKKNQTGFFDEYFTGQEPLPDPADRAGGESGLKEQTRNWDEEVPKRFELKEDDELLKNILPPEDQAPVDDGELPFRLDNMKTGILSELPLAQEDGGIVPQENPEDADPVFTPPTEAKLEDVLDPLTQKAVDAGMPLDRAVVAGRRMAAGDDGDLTPEEHIESQIAETAASPPRIIQYHMPTLDLLDPPKPKARSRQEIKYELEEKANRLLETLHSFKVEAKIINITQGPSVTRFELQPGFGVKVSKITGLTDDIALSLAAPGVRIEAPIPGKSAIGIEIPNRDPSPVPIREVLESDKFQSFQSRTAFALGKDIAGNCVVADIAKFPHVLIAGQTGSGKSVCINSLILSILFKAKPDEVKLIMVDPKMVELGIYNGIPHLLIPVVTDPKHAAGALNWAVGEMQNRYNLLKDNNVRNLKGYNALMEERGEPDSKLPEIVIIIDEFADLMMAAKSEVEDAINRLAALARAAGMYLVIATQRPTVNVITGVIKANIPSRIAFNVTSQIDSRTILDAPGADKLLGRGDMLYNPSGAMKPMRIQGNFVSDQEIERVIDFIKSQYEADYDEEIIENIQKEQERVTASLEGGSVSGDEDGDMTRGGTGARDELFFQAVEMVLDSGQASVAMFQRRFKIGYQRAARLIDQMEERRIIGPYEGTKPRQVLISRQEFLEMKMNEQG